MGSVTAQRYSELASPVELHSGPVDQILAELAPADQWETLAHSAHTEHLVPVELPHSELVDQMEQLHSEHLAPVERRSEHLAPVEQHSGHFALRGRTRARRSGPM